MSFTTQSESVPLVEATRFATGSPAIFDGRRQDVGRVDEHVRPRRDLALVAREPLRHALLLSHAEHGYGRPRNGTGLAGSETYSSYAVSPAFGGAKPAFPPAER